MQVREIAERLRERGFLNADPMQLGNMGLRLEGKNKIRRTKTGWTLTNPMEMPILTVDYVWGPIETFNSHELAARRRELILQLLERTESGLNTLELVRELRAVACGLPVGKDIVRVDMDGLKSQKHPIVRHPHTQKWMLGRWDSNSVDGTDP